MTDIPIKIASNIKRESVFINQRTAAADRVIKDSEGKIIDVEKDTNVLATGNSAREVLNKVYGKIR